MAIESYIHQHKASVSDGQAQYISLLAALPGQCQSVAMSSRV